jgi:hypothetical protein
MPLMIAPSRELELLIPSRTGALARPAACRAVTAALLATRPVRPARNTPVLPRRAFISTATSRK